MKNEKREFTRISFTGIYKELKRPIIFFNLFKELLKERDLTAVIVNHNEALARLADERYHLQAGTVIKP
jgi:ABC-type lipoprotein export system ATPase subunit